MLLLLTGYGEGAPEEPEPLIEPLSVSFNSGILTTSVISGVTDSEINSGELDA